MASENGENFIKNLAQFVRTHEKALANALQLRRQGIGKKNTATTNGEASPTHISSFQNSSSTSSTTSALAAAFSLGALSFTSHNIKPAKLTLTPHHLFYLLSRFEDLGIAIGPMNVRLESLQTEQSPANYVSFLSQLQRTAGRSDRDSIHSVSSVRSVMSNMSSLWSGFGLGSSGSVAKTEKAKAQLETDLKYLYSAFTKIPCLRLSPDRKARLIAGYEEFPFDTAVPLVAFKNLSALEICDVDFRQFYGWDRLADQLRSLSVKRAHVDDPTDLLVGIVLDDMDKRRRRSSKAQSSPMPAWPPSPVLRHSDLARANSAPGSPVADDKYGTSTSPRNTLYVRGDTEISVQRTHSRTKSTSPTRPTSSRQGTSYRHVRGNGGKLKRSGSGSSNSSNTSLHSPARTRSSSNLLSLGILPASKWRFLKHLSLADNALTSLTASSLSPLSNTLHSLDLSSNLFSDVPDALASLTALRALNLSNCMIESLHSLARNPLPAITALNLRSNRLASLAGVERLFSLERLDLRDNRLSDPTEIARLTGIPDIREIWVLSNPFVKSYSNYRVTILNLFRGTPGYAEDILIDATAPGYSERRQLRDRVAETQGVPIVKPVPTDWDLPASVDVASTVPIYPELRPAPHVTQSEINVNSGRRKRGPKRRIVDLSADESPIVKSNNTILAEPPKKELKFADIESAEFQHPQQLLTAQVDVLAHVEDDLLPPMPLNPRLDTVTSAPEIPRPLPRPEATEDLGKSIAGELQHLNLNGEAYRRKIEALKDEFGAAWLNVLSQDALHSQRPEQPSPLPSYSPVAPIRPDISGMRTASQGIVSGHRTLG
ncbi:hypothetical protein MMC30_008578 [Trapelia coarctata]|nr:hypothetical protein [Trapelia coarctata]